jgi:hypothetical protein
MNFRIKVLMFLNYCLITSMCVGSDGRRERKASEPRYTQQSSLERLVTLQGRSGNGDCAGKAAIHTAKHCEPAQQRNRQGLLQGVGAVHAVALHQQTGGMAAGAGCVQRRYSVRTGEGVLSHTIVRE